MKHPARRRRDKVVIGGQLALAVGVRMNRVAAVVGVVQAAGQALLPPAAPVRRSVCRPPARPVGRNDRLLLELIGAQPDQEAAQRTEPGTEQAGPQRWAGAATDGDRSEQADDETDQRTAGHFGVDRKCRLFPTPGAAQGVTALQE